MPAMTRERGPTTLFAPMAHSHRNARARAKGAPPRRAAKPAPPAEIKERPPAERPLADRSILLPLALALLAIAIRLPNLGWGLPEIEEEALPMKKALDLWGWSRGQIDWNPRTAGWPSLSFYFHLLIQHLHYQIGHLAGTYANPGDYYVAAWLDPGPLLLVSRGASAVAAGAVVAIGARLATRLAGRLAGVLVGGLLALSPLLVEYGQNVTPDILVALFAALAVDRLIAIYERGHIRDYVWCGVWIGLGISSKYTPVLLLPAVWVAHFLRPQRRGARRGSAQPFVALGAAFLAFAVTSPFVLLDLGTLVRDVGYQTLHLAGGHFGRARPGVVAYAFDVLGPGLGWGGFLAAVVGLGLAVARERGPWWVAAACVVPYYVALALLGTQFPRYMLPLLMPLALGLAGLVLALRRRLKGPALAAAYGALGLITLAPAAIGTWRYHQERGQASTQRLAHRYFEQNPRGRQVAIAAEVLSVSLPTTRWAQDIDRATLAMLTPAQRQRLLGRPIYDVTYMPMYAVKPELSAFYYDLRHYVGFDDIVVSDAVRGRYLADSVRFAPQVRFYRDLDTMTRMAARFAPGESARGPEIRVYEVPADLGDRLEKTRGVLAVTHDPAVSGPLNPPDYMRFVEAMARAAYTHGRWAAAARYYQAMLVAGGEGALDPDKLNSLLLMLARLRVRTEEWEQAQALYRSYLERVPADTAAAKELARLRSGPGR
jgi:hypothetical protein